LVCEFFEVRTQVDRDLTTVSWVDRRLGLIKNLGHHRDEGAGDLIVLEGEDTRDLFPNTV
jgi:hypothetical protein